MKDISKLLLDSNFIKILIPFLTTFNENIDWNDEIESYIKKNKNTEQIISIIKTRIWTDQEIDINDNVMKYINEITNFYFSNTDKNNYDILTIDTDVEIEMDIEYEFNLFHMYLIDFLDSHYNSKLEKIKYKHVSIDEINDNFIIDYVWILMNKEQILKLRSMKNIYHFKYRTIDINENIDYILAIQYLFIEIRKT